MCLFAAEKGEWVDEEQKEAANAREASQDCARLQARCLRHRVSQLEATAAGTSAQTEWDHDHERCDQSWRSSTRNLWVPKLRGFGARNSGEQDAKTRLTSRLRPFQYQSDSTDLLSPGVRISGFKAN